MTSSEETTYLPSHQPIDLAQVNIEEKIYYMFPASFLDKPKDEDQNEQGDCTWKYVGLAAITIGALIACAFMWKAVAKCQLDRITSVLYFVLIFLTLVILLDLFKLHDSCGPFTGYMLFILLIGLYIEKSFAPTYFLIATVVVVIFLLIGSFCQIYSKHEQNGKHRR